MQHTCGIKCDNTKCDFIDKTVTLKDLDKWFDKPCPKCGTNLLPKDDFNFAVFGPSGSDEINKLIEEQLAKEGITAEDLANIKIPQEQIDEANEALKMLYAGDITKII